MSQLELFDPIPFRRVAPWNIDDATELAGLVDVDTYIVLICLVSPTGHRWSLLWHEPTRSLVGSGEGWTYGDRAYRPR